MANTDDIVGPQGKWYIDNIDLESEVHSDRRHPMPLTCYERPPPGDTSQQLKIFYQMVSFRAFMDDPMSARLSTVPGLDARWTSYLPGRARRRIS